MGALTGITMMIVSLIMGVPILRDFEHNIESLMFVNPIKKRDYLVGRFLGSLTILLFVYSALLWGNALGEFMPWRNPEDHLPYNFIVYLQPFFTVVLPILFFGAALFFVTGALSRKMIVVYTQGLVTFVLFILTKSIESEFLRGILDPFSLTTLSSMTDSWTVLEKNSLLIPFNGVLLYSKIFWVVIGVIILIFGYKRFNYNVVKTSRLKKKKIAVAKLEESSGYHHIIPAFTIQQDFKGQCIQLIEQSIFYFISILKEVSFWAIVICAMVIILINSISLGTIYGVDSYPATYFIIEELKEMSGYFFIIILVFYSGELIWKERGANLNLIYDALPTSNFITLSGKLIGLTLTYAVLMVALIISGVIFQASNGYYQFELLVYFNGLILDFLPSLVFFTFISFFIHIVVNKKFIGYMLVFTFFIGTVVLNQLGYNHSLYIIGGSSLGTYSQMNGYGHLLTPFLWTKAYWFAFCFIILIISALLSVRGTETIFKNRLIQAKHNLTKPMLRTGAIALIFFISLGGFILYNTNILNKFWTDVEEQEFRAGYEKNLKQFEYLPQPKITDVSLKVELYPKSRDYTAEGYYMLKNTNDKPITAIHVQKLLETQIKLENVNFEGGAILNDQYKQYHYNIFTLSEALQPGDSIKMKFKQTFTTVGFENSGTNMHIVNNGTFFNNKDFPSLGYNNKYELRRENDRKDFGFSPRKGMAKRNDALEIINGVNGDDGYKINFEIVIGTESDQKAVAPGTLKKEWQENNRNYFHYKMEQPMVNFYSIISARYEVMQDMWIPKQGSVSKPVALEIYYHRGHEYNLVRMMDAMKVSFDYFSENFSPYQYEQMRIMEFPRYAEFAQSFPSTVPFSEGLGFMLDINDETDVDMAFYITAHELAHQWWGLQVVASNVQGRLMILETLSQYSALMVLKQKYSEEKIQKFLKLELESYLEGKNKEDHFEVPMTLVEKQEYIYYRKGALAMYAFQDVIGEANVNLALKRFIKDWNAIAPSLEKNRYATTQDLLGYFREVTPEDKQYIIKDLFETVTFYDNKIVTANTTPLKNGKYQVDIEFNVRKYREDQKGNKIYNDNDISSIQANKKVNEVQSLPLAGYIDLKVYGENNAVFYQEKHKCTTINNILTIVVDSKPKVIMIDPFNKLIDSNSDDNRKEL